MSNEVVKVYETNQFAKDHGIVRLEQWPEGLVFWVGGEIAWKSKPRVESEADVRAALAALERLITQTGGTSKV